MDPQTLANQLSLQYLQAITQLISLNGAPQLVQPSNWWDWGGQAYPPGSVPWQQVAALDLVPNDPLQNVQQQGAGAGFSSNYQLFLNFLNPNPSVTDPKYQGLQQALTNANSNLYTVQENALIAFKNFVNSTQSTETYTAWLSNEGAAQNGLIAQAQQQANSAQSAVTTYVSSLNTPVTTALATYKQGLLVVQNQGGQPQTVAPWFTDHTPYSYVVAITGNNFGGDASNGSSRSFAINQSTDQYSNSEVYGEAGFSFLDWFGIEAGGSFKQIDTSSYASSYSVEFSFQDLSTIEVTPGPWYSPGMPTNFAHGPFSPGYSGFKSGSNIYYFGPQGNLGRMYTSMVVGYRPKVVLNAGTEFASYFNQQIKAEGAVWIGPFVFEAEGGSDTTKGSVEVDGATITATGQGNWPYIVAMVSNWTVPPPNLAAAATTRRR